MSRTELETVKKADSAASIVLTQAMEAAAQGTFGVGGAIIENATGRVIHKMHNNVLKKTGKQWKSFYLRPDSPRGTSTGLLVLRE